MDHERDGSRVSSDQREGELGGIKRLGSVRVKEADPEGDAHEHPLPLHKLACALFPVAASQRRLASAETPGDRTICGLFALKPRAVSAA